VRAAIHRFALDHSSLTSEAISGAILARKIPSVLPTVALGDPGIGRNHEQDRGVRGFEL